MKIPFLAFILQGIPEQIAIVTLAFVISKIPLNAKKIIFIGLIMGASSYLIRMFPVTFGVHTLIVIGLLFILLVKIADGNLNNSLIASLLSFLAVIVVETICVSILMPLFNVTSEMLFTNTTIRILVSLPQVFIIFGLSFIILKIRKKKIN